MRIYTMSQRITVMIDDDLVKKLRGIQAKQIVHSPKSVSFSRVLCQTLKKVL